MGPHVGVDLHTRVSQMAVLRANGALTQHRLAHDRLQVHRCVAQVPAPARVAIEASGTWWWLVDVLEQRGHEPVRSHPQQTRAIAAARLQHDRVDPADGCAGGPVRARTGGTHRRHALLARRTLPPTVGQRWSTVSGQRALQALPLTPIPTTIRADCLAPRRRLDHARVARWGDDGRVRRLTTMPGIGPVLALLVVLELADISRCPSATPLASATGLTPRVRASAGSVRVGHRLLRWALVLAATQAARRKGQQIARVALARRLAAICAQVWQAAMDCLAVRRRGGAPE